MVTIMMLQVPKRSFTAAEKRQALLELVKEGRIVARLSDDDGHIILILARAATEEDKAQALTVKQLQHLWDEGVE